MALAEKTTGKRPTKVGIIGDSTAASVSFRKALDEHVVKDQKLTAVVNEVYTPPPVGRDDARAVSPQRAPGFHAAAVHQRAGRQTVDREVQPSLEWEATNFPWSAMAGTGGTPELLKVTGADPAPGCDGRPGELAGQGSGELSQRFVEKTKEPWFGHNSLFAYAHVMILKEALEHAGVAERQKVADAIRTLNMTDGPALLFPGHHLQFDDKGRRMDAQMVMIQWQNGKPVTIYPTDIAAAPAIWKA